MMFCEVVLSLFWSVAIECLLYDVRIGIGIGLADKLGLHFEEFGRGVGENVKFYFLSIVTKIMS